MRMGPDTKRERVKSPRLLRACEEMERFQHEAEPGASGLISAL